MQITGSIFLAPGANVFSIGHDDGVILKIAGFGTPVNTPGPTSFALTPFTINNGGAGIVTTFELDYNETSGAPADLTWTYANGAPVGTTPDGGSTIGLMGLALTGLVTLRKRLARFGMA
jgi:hypothetical protein